VSAVKTVFVRKPNSKRRIGVPLGAGIMASVTFLGTGLAAAEPVPATPERPVALVGSETTTPVMNAVANDATALSVGTTRQVASFNATGTATINTHASLPACSAIARPNGSSAGRAALLASLNAANGCIQAARSSSLDLAAANPNLVYVPFAEESISYAISNTSSLPKSLTLAQLQGYFRCTNPGTYKAMLPQSGSGTRSYWIQQMYTGGTLPSPVPTCVQNGTDEGGALIEEHNGSQVNNTEIVPFSVAQWSSQTSGVIGSDVRGATRLGQVNLTNPFAENFALQRTVYNVIPQSALTGTDAASVATRTVFAGASALMCNATSDAVVVRFGFRLQSNCGDTSQVTP
jgi:ABC-type phosphate transport system substrate-binding protein